MNTLALAGVVCVAVANIVMNILVRRAALESGGYLRGLGSLSFLVALAAGTCSILTLLLVYRLNINLAQGILLMGAASIIGGSIIGFVVFRDRLHPIELTLLIAIAFLFVLRWFLVRSEP
jgi:predicted neutral ceramidase superfamily lipid hydrolase